MFLHSNRNESFPDTLEVYRKVQSSLTERGWPTISVAPEWGDFLSFLCALQKAKTALEVGALAGFGSYCLARGMGPDGRVTALEKNPEFASLAQANWRSLGVFAQIQLMLGDAADSLITLREHQETFDILFLDADKVRYPLYLELLLPLCHEGSILIADNILSHGRTLDETNVSPTPVAMRRFLEQISTDPRLDVLTLPFVDGLLVASVHKPPHSS
ncbi:O-methyltransferase [Alicyclobacillus sp. SP_1]|uniref:O-methyltransferase n=1 Tax=Alicyclobacillus sp. SP_1 TaxID=2942475 RepID=UPI0021583BF6|nr:class I SAM-dependent methyltransferase [Alicyclobacillus sp. SP_1]